MASVVLYVVLPGPGEWLCFLAALVILVSWIGRPDRGNHRARTGVEPGEPT